MATVKKQFVFITCLLSGIGVIISGVSVATNYWIYTDRAELTNINDTHSYQKVHYGLFGGTMKLTYMDGTMPITMTCLAKENVCAYLCAESTEARYTLLKNLYKNVDGLVLRCQTILVNPRVYNKLPDSHNFRADKSSPRKFINCGVWVATILFLVVSMLFGLISAALAMYNTVSNPVEVFLSIYGIYIYNAVASFSLIIAMVLWGVMYNKSIFHNVAIFFTLYQNQMTSDKTAYLGYSYWINIAPLILYMSSICVLYLRQYFISKDPGHQTVQMEENGDPVIYLY